MTFKVGDRARCLPGGLQIWVEAGKVYEVKAVTFSDPTPPIECHRSCGHPMHLGKPSRAFLKVDGRLGECEILAACFELVEERK